ncbi:MAG: hypothetical protein ABI467_29455 [Kofleriaceae bacterium]
MIAAMDAATVPYAVCGGLALGILGYPRSTLDIDLLISNDDLARAKTAVTGAGFDIPARQMVFGLRSGKRREVQRLSKLDTDGSLLTVDLLLAGEELVEVFDTRMSVPWRGTTIWVVTREGLATMKRLAGRPRDLADLATLEGSAEDEEES